MHHQDALLEYYNVDAMWGFAISAAKDIHSRMIHQDRNLGALGDVVLHHLLVIRAFDWAGVDIYQQGNFPSLVLHYACILGNQLLLKIKRSKALVGVQICRSDI